MLVLHIFTDDLQSFPRVFVLVRVCVKCCAARLLLFAYEVHHTQLSCILVTHHCHQCI